MPAFQSGSVGSVGLTLNSWEFAAIAGVAVLTCSLLKDLRTRNYALLALNLYVLIVSFSISPLSFLVLGLCLICVYAIGLLRKRMQSKFTIGLQLSIIAVLWWFLFLVRDDGLLPYANPFHYMPVFIIGISYMVFRCISYVMEVEFIDRPSFIKFCTYVLFFPGLIAGPIERYRNFENQLNEPVFDSNDILPALHRIANGMIKKFVIADNLSVFGIFSLGDPTQTSTELLWIGALSQLGLIYLDFSGYCDIVIGLASLMGFKMIENFNSPFKSISIQEFWTRWHISLSTLVRDYIFNPINMLIIKNISRKRQFLIITLAYFFSMILIALWHGVTWGFVAFGAIQGAALVVSQVIKSPKKTVGGHSWVAIQFRRFLVYAFISISLILWLKSSGEWGVVFKKLLGLGV